MNFSRPGAIDLSALRAPAAAAPVAPGTSYAIDVTEQTFQSVVESSLSHVVVLALWSPQVPQSGEFLTLLDRVVASYDGRIQLARVEADTNPGIVQALQVQSVPYVVGVLQGQPVPLFPGVASEAEIRPVLDQLVQVAVQNGISGRAPLSAAAAEEGAVEEAEEVDDPRFAEADAAFDTGDLEGAVAAYEKLLAQHPADAEVQERLAGTRLILRTRGADLQTARQAAADLPDDVDAQLLVADLDVSGGHVEDAFARLIDLVRTADGDDRDRLRARLLELFTVVGTADPRVAAARRALASALY